MSRTNQSIHVEKVPCLFLERARPGQCQQRSSGCNSDHMRIGFRSAVSYILISIISAHSRYQY